MALEPTNTPTDPAPVDPAPTDPPVDPAATAPNPAPSPTDPTPVPVTAPKWAQERIDELTRRRHEAERLAGEKDKEIALLKETLAKGGTPPAPAISEIEMQTRVAQQAALIAFNNQCNEVAAKGNAEFKGGDSGPSFQDAMQTFQRLGGLSQPFLEAALEMDTPHKVLYELAKNPDEAYRILQLPPVRMAAAVAKFGAKLAVPAKATTAPEPTRPVVGGSQGRTGHIDMASPDTDISAWMKARDAQIHAQRAERRKPAA